MIKPAAILLFIAIIITGEAQPTLYGTTNLGGKYNNGVLFSYNLKTSAYNVLVTFDSTNGSNPAGNFTYDTAKGLLYSTTENGGKNNHGVVYGFNPATGKDSTLFMIDNAQGAFQAQLGTPLLYNNKLYFNTFGGGTFSAGALVRCDLLTGKDTTLLSFNSGNPGGLGLTAYNNIFYSTVSAGGDSNAGFIYSYNPSNGNYDVLHSFTVQDGQWPNNGNFTYCPANGLLFATTVIGGNSLFGYGNGVIFSLDPNTGKDSTWMIFNGTDGQEPQAGFTLDTRNGLFYSTTTTGGLYSDGVIFSFNPVTGQQTVLFNFNYAWTNEPIQPNNNLVYDSASNMFYGDAQAGGTLGYGALFSFNPVTDTVEILVNFADTNGSYPYSSMYLINNSSPTGIAEIVKPKEIKVYPNPFNSVINMNFTEDGIHFVDVYDLSGREIESIQCNGKQYELKKGSLANGMYFLKVYDNLHCFIGSYKIIAE